MGICKTLSIFVATLAVLIGIVGKAKPEIFLNIPEIGFLLFMLAGGNNGILPPYFDITPWQGDTPKEWLRDGDVVIATAAKAGTTWMCYCMDAVRRKGSDEVGLPYTDIQLTTPWMEVPQQPGQTWAERIDGYNKKVLPDGTRLKDYWDNAAFPFRIFKSHYMPRGPGLTEVLPVKEMPKVKFLVAARNALEVAKSVHAFFPKHTDGFRKMWGGFPPLFSAPEAAMKEMQPGGQLDSFFFGYVKAWWPTLQEKPPNVMALHYSDMLKDGPGLVDKLAKFAGVELNIAEKAKVVEKCSFKHMKAHAGLFNYRLPLNTRGVATIMTDGAQINKGKSGGAEAGISQKAINEFTEAIDKELTDPKLKKWAMGGGEI